jgi:hypothetical protein
LLELGEEIVRVKWQLSSRSGLAGGVLKGPTWFRARGELVERDAFFYHYRNRIPFHRAGVRRLDGVVLDVYELESAEPNLKVALVMAQTVEEEEGFLHFATASSFDIESASLRAAREYLSLHRYLEANHQRLTQRAADANECRRDLSLFHFKACSDPRNFERFRFLRAGNEKPAFGRCSTPVVWRRVQYPSPVRGFRFLRAESDQLQKIEFGLPEATDGPPLFHPFW